jgi:shikimate kinase
VALLLKKKIESSWHQEALFSILHTPLNTQVERTAKDKDRPLLKDQDPEKVLSDLTKIPTVLV